MTQTGKRIYRGDMKNIGTEKIKVIADVSDERTSPGELTVKIYNPTDKMFQALKRLAFFWLVAIGSVLIPILHFVLVPLFLVLGVFFAVRTYRSEGAIIAGTTTCPHCKAEITVQPSELQWPVTEICQSCARVVRLRKD